ncbi:MAG: ABC transporter ATP-binding protein [Myxococcota bacterium]|jgi:ABC-type multidrug transport system fused ATPase/permease subunit|nr:ABC transporter ATP-binding protein [Myxococcota bacterium]
MTSTSQDKDLQGLSRLGDGSRHDRLHLRLILQIGLRCLHLLRPVRRHVLLLFAGFSGLSLLLLPIGLLFVDTLWTRVLQGNPMLEIEAWFFRVPIEAATSSAGFDAELRREVAEKLILWSVLLSALLAPPFIGLYYYQIWILQRVNQKLRVDLLSHFQSLSLRFHAEVAVGDAVYRLTQDSAMVTQLVQVLILTPFTAIPQFLYSVVIIGLFAPMLGLVLLGVLVPSLALGWWFSQRMRTRFRSARETNAALTGRIQETLAGIKVIKAYGAEPIEQAAFEGASHRAFATAFQARNLYAVFGMTMFWTFGSFALFITALGTIEVMKKTELAATALGFTLWNLGLYNYFKARLGGSVESLKDLFRTWGRAQDIAIGLDRVFEVMDHEPEILDDPDAIALSGVQREISFQNVSFRYRTDRPVFEGVNLSAQIGTITAIVGPTGSGKSTLMALLLRLFDPSSGRVEIDGIDLKTIQTASLREHVSIALQENILFGNTIRENIRFAEPDASDSAIQEAARIAAADGFIEDLPGGYDTLLGERGSKLSTGQRQRLSIARAIIKDTPILILDEPTAALDAVTEQRVLQNLAEWGRNRAIFIITHRLSTVRRADQVAFLGGGTLAEIGSHEELMARSDGAYRALVEAEGGAAP